jgi:hypothetical protein
MLAFSNEQLMWGSITIWLLFIVILGYFAFFGKTTTFKLPSGNTSTLPGADVGFG